MLKRFLAPILAIPFLAGCVTGDYNRQAAQTLSSTPAPLEASGAVNTNDPRATAAGEEILAKGGSATDAAIAIMLALTVVEPQSSGIGGGGFLVRGDASGEVHTFDGRETSPKAATERRFLDQNGEVLPRALRTTSGLSIGVPGNIALAAKAHRRYGKLGWAQLFEPAIRLASDGFVMNRRLNESLASRPGRADKTEYAKRVFFGLDGKPLPIGTRIFNPELASFLEDVASKGPGTLYETEGAGDLAEYVAANTPQDGKMVAADIEAYRAKERPPICAPYRQYRICGMGPPSSGGIAILQMLGQLERFDLAALGPDSAGFWHLFLESQRLAYADRELYIADPDFIDIPVKGLSDPQYIAQRGALIDARNSMAKAEPGTPPGFTAAWSDGDEGPESGTSHFSVADGRGNVVSYTSTIEGAYGSGLIHRGFYLNNELTDFSLTPIIDGNPVANRVEGGKRPRSSMAPTVVFDGSGRPILVIGAMGGGTIPVQTARAIIGVLDFGMDVETATSLPFAMYYGETLLIEQETVLAAKAEELREFGHSQARFIPFKYWATGIKREGGIWSKGIDPRLAPLIAETE